MSRWTDEQRTGVVPLTAADRCDRCGAQAQARMNGPKGGVLEFCAHHYRAHLPELLGDGWAVAVHTEMVNA